MLVTRVLCSQGHHFVNAFHLRSKQPWADRLLRCRRLVPADEIVAQVCEEIKRADLGQRVAYIYLKQGRERRAAGRALAGLRLPMYSANRKGHATATWGSC